MGELEHLPVLPEGWTWEGPAESYLAWLGEGFLDDPVDGPLPPGCADSTWILHAQFFRPPEVAPEPDHDVAGFGFGGHTPEGWRSITWAEVASRKGVPLQGPASDEGTELPPCYRWKALLDDSEEGEFVILPALGEEDFTWPTEGSLGKSDLETLLPVLTEHTGSTRIHAAFSPLRISGPEGANRAVTFDLATMLETMLATGVQEFTPEFWWPEDRAWVVWTDYDLMGTRVFGNKGLINTLRSDPDIETLDWHRVRLEPPRPPRPPSRLELRFQTLLAQQEVAKAREAKAAGHEDD